MTVLSLNAIRDAESGRKIVRIGSDRPLRQKRIASSGNQAHARHIVIRTHTQQLTARSQIEVRQTSAPLLEQLMTKSEVQSQSVRYFPIVLNEPLILGADRVLGDSAEVARSFRALR